jgi:hypothetical protein
MWIKLQTPQKFSLSILMETSVTFVYNDILFPFQNTLHEGQELKE